MAVGQEAVLRGREAERRAGFVQHDEVVAGALHLGEADSHRRIMGGAPAPVGRGPAQTQPALRKRQYSKPDSPAMSPSAAT